ncbi:hypothetical protein Adu01nite_21270 [Paractinoplanes durhamensis]|uniref:Uncharacterized protein n=1 Tax=Paractinoplanes durhamensis TaxID=113563 RepID=A0ABQ3YT82_9ACTN|nr:hypothetical protein Adu01nite_21270 [Actinoplanes durhamensis]
MSLARFTTIAVPLSPRDTEPPHPALIAPTLVAPTLVAPTVARPGLRVWPPAVEPLPPAPSDRKGPQ